MTDLKFSKRLSITLFVVGTTLFVAYAATLSPVIGFIGFVYTVLAFLAGMVYFLVLGSRIGKKRLDPKTGQKSINVLVMNIPVAIIYFVLVIILVNTARITFENTTGQDLSLIKIVGCDSKEIKSLKKGESKTVWIYISNDCAVEIWYAMGDGQMKKETVASYLTNFGGIIATYKIGSNRDIQSSL